MAGKAGKSGGSRSGAGRKPAVPIYNERHEWNGWSLWRGRKFFTTKSWTLRQGENTEEEWRFPISEVPQELLGNDMAERIYDRPSYRCYVGGTLDPNDPEAREFLIPRGRALANYIEAHGQCIHKGYEVR